MNQESIKFTAEQMRSAILLELGQHVPGLFGPDANNGVKDYLNSAPTIHQVNKRNGDMINIVAGYENGTHLKIRLFSKGGVKTLETISKWSRNDKKALVKASWTGEGDVLDKLSFGFIGTKTKMNLKGSHLEVAVKGKDNFEEIDLLGYGQKDNRFFLDIIRGQAGNENSIRDVRFKTENVLITSAIVEGRGIFHYEVQLPRAVEVVEPLLFKPLELIANSKDARIDV